MGKHDSHCHSTTSFKNNVENVVVVEISMNVIRGCLKFKLPILVVSLHYNDKCSFVDLLHVPIRQYIPFTHQV